MFFANEAVTAVLAYTQMILQFNGGKIISNYYNGRVTLIRKIQNIELCIAYQY